MAGIKISALPSIVTPLVTDYIPVSQGDVTYKETITQLATLITASSVNPADVQNQAYSYVADSGAANAYVGIVAPAVAAYAAGQRFDLLIANDNTGASTLTINALTAKNILRDDGTALVAGDIVAGMIATFEFNGVSFQLLNPSRRILGTTTNNNAAAGYVGEYISSQVLKAAPLNFALSNTLYDVTSIALTPGDWDVSGNIGFDITIGATIMSAGFSNNVATTLPDLSLVGNLTLLGGGTYGNNTGFNIPSQRISLAANATIYMVAAAVFGAGAVGGFGYMAARRVR
jgi:hypothetical protein